MDARLYARIFDPPVSGKTVLVAGCGDGSIAIEAVRQGAARVLAVDHENWQAPGARDAFRLARSRLTPRMEALDLPLVDLSAQTIGRFDIVLLLGGFDTLPDPEETLTRISRIAVERLVFDVRIPGKSGPRRLFGSGAGSVEMRLNRSGMKTLLDTLGFATVRFTRLGPGHTQTLVGAMR
jgi:ubiquinone/menaquinone biosynthesis C-methylase UbiE